MQRFYCFCRSATSWISLKIPSSTWMTGPDFAPVAPCQAHCYIDLPEEDQHSTKHWGYRLLGGDESTIVNTYSTIFLGDEHPFTSSLMFTWGTRVFTALCAAGLLCPVHARTGGCGHAGRSPALTWLEESLGHAVMQSCSSVLRIWSFEIS
jgi:hypothetical protein